jgi:hypothetical protein
MNALPPTLTDPDGNIYKLVRQREFLPDGRENIALYELLPLPDRFSQFTPELGYLEGQAETPHMIPISR